MTEDSSERYLVVSTDGHAGLPPHEYRDYLDPQYRERFDEVLQAEIAQRQEREKTFLIKEYNEKWRAGNVGKLAAAWDSDLRTQVMDEDGVAAEVIFPDGITEMNAPPFGAGLGLKPWGVEPELQWAGARAHNRWIAEFCRKDPLRRVGLAIVPMLYDVDAAVAEVIWAHDNGLQGILIPALMETTMPTTTPSTIRSGLRARSAAWWSTTTPVPAPTTTSRCPARWGSSCVSSPGGLHGRCGT